MAATSAEQAAREEVCELIHTAQARGDTTFHLTNNFVLRALPEQIRALKSTLQVLHIDNNYDLAILPPAIGELTQLRWLNVSYNKLTELPTEIGRLSRLERLHVNNNKIKFLPLELWGLRELEELRCESNQLCALPTGVLSMRRLREVTVDNNPLLTEAQVDGADLYDLFPKLPWGDCASCRVRFRDYTVGSTFHKLPGATEAVPVVHYCCSDNCMRQLMTRLASDDSPLSPLKALASSSSASSPSKTTRPAAAAADTRPAEADADQE